MNGSGPLDRRVAEDPRGLPPRGAGALRAPAGLVEVAAPAGLYYAAARLGLLLSFRQTNATPVWPPSGIAVAVVLLRGGRIWPGILLGAFVANVVVFLGNGAAVPASVVAVSGAIGIGNTLEALTVAALLRRWVGDRRPLDRARDVFAFVVAALLACVVSCTVGATSLGVGGVAGWPLYGTVWLTWWLGDVAGVLVVAPVLLTWGQWPRLDRPPRRLAEALLLLAMLALANQAVFGGMVYPGGPLAYMLIPFIVWAAFQFGLRGVSLASLLVSAAAVWGTIRGHGPFVGGTRHEALLLLQVFVGTVTVTGLVLAAVLAERQRAEQALHRARDDLARHAAQLEAANKELEAFSYSVSHDLRAPLRAIDGFSRIVLEDYAPRLPAECWRYLELVRGSARRMGQLVDDLLTFSRLSRQPLSRRPVASEDLVRRCLEDLHVESDGRPVEFAVGELPEAHADPAMLRQVWFNLLANALKFTRGREPAVIEIGCERGDGELRYFVKDNGTGFDMRYAHKLFGVFQRLHRAEEYEGTGVGLALVQRIVHRHGGRVWAEAAVDRGARFTFTLGEVAHDCGCGRDPAGRG
jgi:signal transduction histidine kinase